MSGDYTEINSTFEKLKNLQTLIKKESSQRDISIFYFICSIYNSHSTF